MSPQDDVERLFQKNKKDLSYQLPSQLKEGILAQIYGRSPQVVKQRPRIPWFVGSLAAASLALIVTFQVGQYYSKTQENEILVQEVVSGHIRSMMASHLSDVASSNQHTVKPWFEGKLDFAPSVKFYPTQEFVLLGGRLDYVSSRPVAAIVYAHDQHFINVFEWPSSSGANEGLQKLLVRRGYQIFSWQKEGMSYWMISDLNAVDLQKFAVWWTEN